jgi:PAS domain S-box-containing protein
VSAKIKILQLEYIAGDVTLVSNSLVSAGIFCDIRPVSTRQDYITALLTFLPDLIIANDTLPGLPVTDVLTILRENGSSIPLIVLSGAGAGPHTAAIVQAIKQGAFDYILKEDIDGLPGAVLAALNKAATAQQPLLTEQSYRQIVETAQEGIWILDANLVTTFVNKKTCDLLGYPAEEIIGRSNLDFKDEEDLVNTIARTEQRMLGVTETHESIFITKGGERVYCIVATNGLFDADGKYIGTLAMLTDITERKTHENALKRSEANLSAIIENTTDLVYSLDRDLKVITYNQIFKNTIKHVYGFDIVTGASTLELISNFDAEMGTKWKAIYARALNGEAQQFINKYTFGPEHVYLSYSINPIWETDKVIGLSCFSRDITKQKLDEASIRKSEASLRTIFNNTDRASMLLDSNGCIVSFNNLAQKFSQDVTGNPITVGSSILDCVGGDWQDIVLDILKNTKNGRALHYEESREINGATRWFDVTWAGIKDREYEDFGYICTFRDITDKKELEIEREQITTDLLQRNKALEQFTYIISHNLRAPVANIIGLSSLLAGTAADDDDDTAEISGSISRSAHKLDEIISDLNRVLQVSQVGNENIEAILLSQLVADIKFSIGHLIEKEHVTIVTELKQDEIRSLKSFIHSIFYNLILNSIKYRNPLIDPVITIKTKAANGQLTISYRDNGRGIDTSKYGNEIFGLYKRFDTSVEGKGMGLFMVKTQVESLGGAITINSVLGEGAEFLLHLPQIQLITD